jgi:hypothetical protein
MKRPQMIALFAPAPAPAEGVADPLLDLLLDESKGYLEDYYARLEPIPGEDDHDAAEEKLDLQGRDDLIRRVKRDQDCAWACYLPLVFYPAEVYPTLFRDPAGSPGTTVLLRIDPVITKSLEEEPDSRMPFVWFLTRVAEAIGSNGFISGPYIEEFRPLRVEQLGDLSRFGRLYAVGWKPDTPEEAALLSALKPPEGAVQRTTTGYHVVTNFPG